MKLTTIFIVFVAVATVVSGQTTGSMATTDGLYTFSWAIVGNQLTGVITVTTAANTWAAVGFSDDNMMPMSDVVIGGNNGVNSFIEDRWITNGRTPANVVYDTTQDITVTSATRVSGVLTITFTRPLNTNDATQDVSLENRCVWVLWAYGGIVGDFTASPVTGLTGHTYNGVFPEQLCSGNVITSPTPTPSSGTAITSPTPTPSSGTAITSPTPTPSSGNAITSPTPTPSSVPAIPTPIVGSLATIDGLYTFAWSIANNRITGTITVTTGANTWAAVGFSDDNMMPMSDAVIGGNDGTNSFVEDRWITNGRTPANVVYDTTQDITVTSATRVSGVLTIRFTRPLNTNDAQDVSLENRCVWVLWAYGGIVGDFTTTPVTGLTGHTAKGVFPWQLCSGNVITSPTPTPSSGNVITSPTPIPTPMVPPRGTMATTDGLYRFSWVVMGNQIVGTIVVTTGANTWAAVGFSDDQMMPMSDVVIGGNNNAGQSFVEDRWITNGRLPANVLYDTSQDITVTSTTRVSGVLTITFTRPLNTNDATQDVSLENRCVWVLWAYGGPVGDFTTTPVGNLGGHTVFGVFPNRLCSGNAITSSTPTSTTITEPIPTSTDQQPTTITMTGLTTTPVVSSTESTNSTNTVIIISTSVGVLVILLVGVMILVVGSSLCLMRYMKKRLPLREEVIANTDIAQNNLSYKPIGSQWMNLEDNPS